MLKNEPNVPNFRIKESLKNLKLFYLVKLFGLNVFIICIRRAIQNFFFEFAFKKPFNLKTTFSSQMFECFFGLLHNIFHVRHRIRKTGTKNNYLTNTLVGIGIIDKRTNCMNQPMNPFWFYLNLEK